MSNYWTFFFLFFSCLRRFIWFFFFLLGMSLLATVFEQNQTNIRLFGQSIIDKAIAVPLDTVKG
jgi:hypothetical protein